MSGRRMFKVTRPGPQDFTALPNRLTLSGVKRYESALEKWRGKTVLIYSQEHGAFWRDRGHGYTEFVKEAGRFDFVDAVARTIHCGPEKRIEYYEYPTRWL